ncbi:hypothetical protein [uncultured Bdellovibrio sp.]|uniref:hypothetical protein n=1 Tax=Bdellovibrio sp. HCB-162 TaxID=3394234 RepID=UPI0025FE53EA|nr:hypothetical protein [uncultured Bdellovibrio sp.]
MKALSAFLILCASTPSAYAASTTTWDLNNQDAYSCYARNGVYSDGVCIDASASAHVAAILSNGIRKGGGNESSVGDTVVEGDVKVTKAYDNPHFREIFISVSAIPRDEVLNYNEKNEQNYHNSNRLRADGFVDRPWILANIGANIAVTNSQDVTVLAGSFPASGLDPLKGKPSRYYMTAPYGIMVRYDKGIQMNYQLKEELDRVILASFSVIDGDGLKGESNIDPADSRANSYPSYAGTMELRITNALRKVFEKSSPYLKNHDLYIGVTGSRGDTGSYAGQKRSQDDLTTYLGYMFTSKYGQAEVRVFRSDFNRNKAGNGDGRHGPQVESSAQGVEVAYRGLESRLCTWDFYLNKHIFENNSQYPDGEFTYDNVRGVKGWTAGTSCRNFWGVDNLDVGFEYGNVELKSAPGTKLSGAYPLTSNLFNLTFTYRFGLHKAYRK